MGCKFSKNTAVLNPPPQTKTVNSLYLTSYEAACRVDQELRSFDSIVHRRTSQVINKLAAGVDVRSLPLDSLWEATENLLEMDKYVLKVFLKCKKDICKSKELFNLVEDYLKNSLETLNFCTVLGRYLKRVRDGQSIVSGALLQFEEEKRDRSTIFSRTLQELNNFKASGDPFDVEFFLLFQSIYNKQMVMFSKLQAEKSTLDKKLRSIKIWKKLSSVLFVATFTGVLICSVVATAVAAPPVLTALAAAAAVPLGSMGKWVNSIWSKYENEIKGQYEFIGAMEFWTEFVVVRDLQEIRVLVDRLEIHIEALLPNADLAPREAEAAETVIDDIKKKLSEFMQAIERLSLYADKGRHDVENARRVILNEMIPKHKESAFAF